jgi:hypothetical protein
MPTAEQPIIQTASSPGSTSKKSVWAGRIISGLITAFMIFDGVIHIMRPAPVVEGFAKLNFPLRFAVPLGIVELLCIVLYVLPVYIGVFLWGGIYLRDARLRALVPFQT